VRAACAFRSRSAPRARKRVRVERSHQAGEAIVGEPTRRGALLSMLAGSGSAVFGVFSGPPDAAAIARDNGCDVLMTRTSDRVVQVETAE